jgi:hypothetical protein
MKGNSIMLFVGLAILAGIVYLVLTSTKQVNSQAAANNTLITGMQTDIQAANNGLGNSPGSIVKNALNWVSVATLAL